MHLSILIISNIFNAMLFGLMWQGFYPNKVFFYMALFQLLITVLSFSFYFMRNSNLAQILIKFKQLPEGTNKAKLAYTSSLVGAYALSMVNYVVAVVMLSINGTLDIWVSGNVT